MHPSAVWLLLALSATAYRQPSTKEAGVGRYVTVSNELGYRLQRAQSYQQGNQLLSPYGISKLLSVLYQGSSGRTQQQLGHLGYRALEQHGFDISQSYQQLRRYLQRGSGDIQLEEATALLYPSDYSVSPQYQQVLESSYKCFLQQVDYRQGSRDAVEGVNRWIQQETRGRISQIADVDASSGLALLSGIYYQGSLQSQSGQERVQRLPFYNEGESSPQSVLYYQTQSRYRYYQDQQLQAMKFPYQDGDYSLLVVLPTQQSSVRQLQQQVSSGTIQRVLSRSQETQVRVSLPQFRLDYSLQLEQDLQSLGITSIFGTEADLSGFSSRRSTYVSQISQRTVVEVGEYGSGRQYQYESGQERQYGSGQNQYGGQNYRYGGGRQGQYERQQYRHGAGQAGQYEGQQYQHGMEEGLRYEGQQQYQYGAGPEGQYEGQQYQYGAGQGGPYEGRQYQSGAEEEDQYEGQQQHHYGAGYQSQYGDELQYQYGGRRDGQYESGQVQYGNGQQYRFGTDQESQYGSSQQYGDQQEYEYGLSDQDVVAEFQADRPFLFYIIHEETGLNLLAGRVSQL